MRIWIWLSIGCLLCLHPCAAQGQKNDLQTRINQLLHNVVPTETTLDDVTKLLGTTGRTGPAGKKSPVFYEFDDFNVLVSYTTGKSCAEEPTYGWRIDPNRVLTFDIIVKAPLHPDKLKDIGVDLSKYKKDVDPTGHVPETIFKDSEAGIRVYVNGPSVTSIVLVPAQKYEYLMCPNAPKTTLLKEFRLDERQPFGTFAARHRLE